MFYPFARSCRAVLTLFSILFIWIATSSPAAKNTRLFDNERRKSQSDMDPFWFDLVSKPPPSFGLLIKAGMLPLTSWSADNFNPTTFNRWLAAHGLAHEQMMARATTREGTVNPWKPAQTSMPTPISHRCRVTINHQYKFIMIRTRKAASTTLYTALEKACKAVVAAGKECTNMDLKSVATIYPPNSSEGVDPEKVWKEYTVFTTTRNPYARGASSYTYLTSTWANTTGTCAVPTLAEYCEQPMLLGAMVDAYKCRAFRNNQDAQWDWYHVEPSALCWLTGDGRPAVDFMVRSETFREDAAALFALLNSRRDPSLPELELDATWENRGQSREERLRFIANKLQAFLNGDDIAPEAMKILRVGVSQLGLDMGDRAGLEAALQEVTQSMQQVAGTAERCNRNLSEEEMLACEQRKYADMWRQCGRGCVRAFARFIKPDLDAGGYGHDWPLSLASSQLPRKQRLQGHHT